LFADLLTDRINAAEFDKRAAPGFIGSQTLLNLSFCEFLQVSPDLIVQVVLDLTPLKNVPYPVSEDELESHI
jgi:hypothetical protein